jgi:alpha-galactosidase/6-phospho-beta-glucosidase family protein
MAMEKRDGDDPLPIRIAYVGGGSRGWAHALMRDLLVCPNLTGEVRLYDIDRPAAELNAKYGNWLQGHPDAKSKWKYRAVATLKTALKNADFVLLSIQPGPIEYMRVDLDEPMRYGIYQSVGDTVGPGGCIRALRATRDYKIFGEAIGRHAPDAWVLNFSNPMTVCTRALYEAFPAVKAYGCCHEVFATQGTLAVVHQKVHGGGLPLWSDVDVNVLGINHFTWVDRATWRGRNILSSMDEYMKRPGAMKYYSAKYMKSINSVFVGHGRVARELYKRFGVLGAAGCRHLAEFVPWFLTSRDSCYKWGFVLTPASYRIERFKQAPKQFKKELRSGKFPEVDESGEEYLRQMLALVGKGDFVTNVNMPNRGQMLKIPHGPVVETNAFFSHNSVQPVASGGLPDNVNWHVMRHVCNQESLVKSVFERDRDLAFQAFANDALVRIPLDKAWNLFKTMVRKTDFEF